VGPRRARGMGGLGCTMGGDAASFQITLVNLVKILCPLVKVVITKVTNIIRYDILNLLPNAGSSQIICGTEPRTEKNK